MMQYVHGIFDPWTDHIWPMCSPTHNMHTSELNCSLSRIACSCVILCLSAETDFWCFTWLETVFICIWLWPFYLWMWHFFLITPEKLGFKSYVLLSIVLIHKLSVCCVENIKSPWIIYWDKYMTGGKLIHLQLIVRYIPKFNCSYWRWFSCYIVFPLLVERLERAACWQTQIYGKFLLKQGLSEVWRQWAGATRKEL